VEQEQGELEVERLEALVRDEPALLAPGEPHDQRDGEAEQARGQEDAGWAAEVSEQGPGAFVAGRGGGNGGSVVGHGWRRSSRGRV
jgi:ApbE superfamily uncharacterized protein (UPF0280 family)